MSRQSDFVTPRPEGSGDEGGPGGSASSGQPSSHRPMPSEQQMKLIRERLRLFLVLILGLIVLMTQPLPFRLAGILLSLAALWIGLRLFGLQRKLRRSGIRTPGVITVITGVTLASVLLFLLIADAIWYPLVADLEDCQAGANTQRASELCQRDARDRLDELVQRLTRESQSRSS